ncbi:MAG: type 1 glutamine amidotransferase domain-containing protein [Bacillota bacterium]|nr:type 1 glutamine amidotransferase domain-containing protein [Bacillota bacterium]MDW7682855.1 type 1 glutamine amidotransferase domain-containing protein [Bacillota bacterium]
MKLKGKRIALLVEDLYEDNEYWYPYYRLLEEGAEVVTVAPEKKSYKSKHGAEAVATVTAANALGEDYDALVIPGGFSPDKMRRSREMVELVQKIYHAGHPVAAICHGPWMLVSAGALKGRQATCFFSIRDDVENAGAEYVDAEVIQDGNVITSRQPADLPAFCRTLIDALS